MSDFSNPSEKAMKNLKMIHTQDITKELMEKKFNDSKNILLGFESKEEAILAMTVNLQRHNTTRDFIDGNIPFFAVPIVFKVQIDEKAELKSSKKLTGSIIHNYMEIKSIPWHSSNSMFKGSQISSINEQIKKYGLTPKVFNINKKDISTKVEAYFYATNPVRLALVNLNNAKQDLKSIKDKEAPPTTPDCNIL